MVFMKEEIFIPKMGQTMTEGTIEKWLRKDGDTVKKGEGVVEIMTDKITTTIDSPADGVLQILVEEGNTVPVGEIIGEIV
jgi:pyruvate/2-oxoglutarate dehydrogenase complex dihydrolipoamide acyltransferase (E2) component